MRTAVFTSSSARPGACQVPEPGKPQTAASRPAARRRAAAVDPARAGRCVCTLAGSPERRLRRQRAGRGAGVGHNHCWPGEAGDAPAKGFTAAWVATAAARVWRAGRAALTRTPVKVEAAKADIVLGKSTGGLKRDVTRDAAARRLRRRIVGVTHGTHGVCIHTCPAHDALNRDCVPPSARRPHAPAAANPSGDLQQLGAGRRALVIPLGLTRLSSFGSLSLQLRLKLLQGEGNT